MTPSEITASVPEPVTTRLYGRGTECQSLDRLIADLGTARGQALVLSGGAGAGKTALLDYLTARAAAAGIRVLRAAGVQSEAELAFAGLHQLCDPMLDHCDRLPVPQRNALRMALGFAEGPSPAPFLLGLAVLGLLSQAAEERPLLCVVDDEQWLDQASAQALGFAGRRLPLTPGPVGLVFAAREPSTELAGLPDLTIGGLCDDDARELLTVALPGPVDQRARDLIVAESGGNPRALLDMPSLLSPAELAGGFGIVGTGPLSGGFGGAGKIYEDVIGQLNELPEQVRRLLQLGAADPSGDPSLVRRAAAKLGIPLHAGASAVETGLVRFDAFVRFRNLQARSAVYWSTSPADRRQFHAVLAEVTDQVADPDRRAWHQARGTAGPDEEVAAELERCAPRAQARGGLAAAAAFLELAVLLTPDPVEHRERILAAAQASLRAGAFAKALDLLATAEAGPLDELAAARVAVLRGQLSAARGASGDATGPLLDAAGRLERLDADLAREAYLSAWTAAQSAGSLAVSDDLLEVSCAARALPPAATPRAVDQVLEGLALFVTDGPVEAAPVLRRAVDELGSGHVSNEEAFSWGWQAPAAAVAAWDNAAWRALLVQQAGRARGGGALGQLPDVLRSLGMAVSASGEFASASALAAEADAISHAIGAAHVPVVEMAVAALRGREAEAGGLIDATVAEATKCGQGIALAFAHWAAAVLHNGHGRYAKAMAAARQATEDGTALPVAMWALPELVEAATHAGDTGLARDALKRLAEITQACATDAALGLEARCRALLGPDTDAAYREAIDRLSRTELRPELARTRLLYGEWLRRERRVLDARNQLRTAHDMLTEMGMEGFAGRARRELRATGVRAGKHSVGTGTELTAQEALIARLACEGRTNSEIGGQLFLSARTIGWHLARVYVKLGINSRRQLNAALVKATHGGQPAYAPSFADELTAAW